MRVEGSGDSGESGRSGADGASWNDAAGAVSALLQLTIRRTWWILAVAALLSFGVLQVPQGREFFGPDISMSEARSLIIAVAILCILLGGVTVWLVAPHAGDGVSAPLAAPWFAGGFVPLATCGLVASMQHILMPNAAEPTFVMLVGGLAGWFSVYIGQKVLGQRLSGRPSLLLWSCWTVLGCALIWLRGPWAAAVAITAQLAAHLVIARVAPKDYATGLPSPLPRNPPTFRLAVVPLASLTVVIAGYNNTVDPVWSLHNAFGPLATLTFCLGFWVAVCFLIFWASSALVWVLRRWVGDWLHWQTVGAIFSMAIVAFIGFSFATGHMAEAQVRRLEVKANEGVQKANRAASTEDWIRQRLQQMATGPRSAPDSPIPVVIVAAEGGGIRAAFWTASVLAGLHDRYEDFPGSLIAMSGVSGGSVGMTVYQATAHSSLLVQNCNLHDCVWDFRAAVQKILGSDFLSPALMALMIGEPLRDAGISRSAMDRAQALELALQQRFRDVADEDPLEMAICELQESEKSLLLPGLTDAQSGRRVVLGCLPRATPSADITQPLWLTASQPLRTSTAALLSARFPLISPAGLITDGKQTHRIVDGGYSDNTGTGTAVEIVKMVDAATRELDLTARIRPIILVVSNSPPAKTDVAPSALLGGIFGLATEPLLALDAVRARIASDYRRWLKQVTDEMGSKVTVIEWRLPQKPDAPYPLGWYLSQQTSNAIADKVSESMIGESAKLLESATGWKVRSCKGENPESLCEELRQKGKR